MTTFIGRSIVIGMKDVLNIIMNKPVGSIVDFSLYDVSSQKELSATLSKYGWKKIYHYAGEWKRVCKWKYLTYYEGRKHGWPYARLRIKEHAPRLKEIKNSDVHIYAGMRMTQAMIDITMVKLGYKLEKNNIWRKK